MTLIIKYKKIIRISVGLLIIPLALAQLMAHSTQVSADSSYAGCYTEQPSTSNINITVLTKVNFGESQPIDCPAPQSTVLNPKGQSFKINSAYCYYVEQVTDPAGNDITAYDQEDCTTLVCQMGSSIPAGVNCGPSDPCNPGSYDYDSALCSNIIQNYINPIILFLGGGVGLIIIIMIVIGSIQFITSGGDPNHVAEAKKRISNAILALIAWLLVYAFLEWIVPGGLLFK
jgi:hypothetical protein